MTTSRPATSEAETPVDAEDAPAGAADAAGAPAGAAGAPVAVSEPERQRRRSFAPSLSPDGRAFADIVDEGGYPRAVQRHLDGTRVTGSRDVRLPVDGPVDKVIYSPDGRWLACSTLPHAGNRSQVWAVTNDPDDPTARRLDDDTGASADLVGWSGDQVALTIEQTDGVGVAALVDPSSGDRLELDRRPEGRLLDSWAGATVVRVGGRGDRSLRVLRGEEETALFADDPGSTSDPAVVLDDRRPRWIPYLHRLVEAGPDGYVRVLVRSDYAADRTRLLLATVVDGEYSYQVIADREDADLDEFAVSADASTVALLWNVDGGRSEFQLCRLADGSLAAPTPLPGPVAEELTISADGALVAMTVQGPGWEPSVELLATAGQEWVAIERLPPDPDTVLPTSVTLAARDGTRLQAWWYASPVADGPAPTLVDFHGGPEGQARPTYHDLYPLLLARGWHVVAPNIRGSAGFGRAYSHADDLERRWTSLNDPLDVADWLVGEGIADPGRLVISGRSYGGYLTQAVLAFHPGTYAAGVSTCGMSDLRTFYEHTEPWIGRAAVTKYGHPERDAELLAALSPLGAAEAIDVPVLFVHGTQDTNVPPGESVQMQVALRERGVPAELILVPEEGHQIYKPENRAAVSQAICDWLMSAVPPPA